MVDSAEPGAVYDGPDYGLPPANGGEPGAVYSGPDYGLPPANGGEPGAVYSGPDYGLPPANGGEPGAVYSGPDYGLPSANGGEHGAVYSGPDYGLPPANGGEPGAVYSGPDYGLPGVGDADEHSLLMNLLLNRNQGIEPFGVPGPHPVDSLSDGGGIPVGVPGPDGKIHFLNGKKLNAFLYSLLKSGAITHRPPNRGPLGGGIPAAVTGPDGKVYFLNGGLNHGLHGGSGVEPPVEPGSGPDGVDPWWPPIEP